MQRKIILAIAVLIVLGALYAAKDSLKTVSALVLTARDLVSPAAESSPPEPIASSAPASPAPPSPFVAKFGDHLLLMGDDGSPHGFDSAKLAGIKYVAFYYSASWCPPCRAFTPDLVSFYREFKPDHPNFELIFVCYDRNDADMMSYMKADSMPWPAVWFADANNPDLAAKKYCGSGIPCLVLVDDNGNVLSDTFQNGQYTDPHHVIEDIRKIVQ